MHPGLHHLGGGHLHRRQGRPVLSFRHQMTMKKIGINCGLALLAALLAGCASTGPSAANFPVTEALAAVTITNQLDAALLQPPTGLFVLGPGDRLDIEMTGNPASRAEVAVGLDGK